MAIPTTAPATIFPYSSLTDPENEIRLLRFLPESTPDDIICSLQHVTRSQAVEQRYTALSYCWGEPSNARPITVNGHEFNVTTNLWEALNIISQHHDVDSRGYFWIDAICINQNDLQEKSEQVHKMWMTYNRADKVFAWLGPENKEVQRELTSLCKRRAGYLYTELPALCGSDYFTRTWIVPEFLQAQCLTLLCGRYSTDFRELKSMPHCVPSVIHRRSTLLSLYDIDLDNRPTPRTVLDAFCSIFEVYRDGQCSEPRDRIFALLGDPSIRRLDGTGWLEPDYTIGSAELVLLCFAWCDYISVRACGHSDPWRVEYTHNPVTTHDALTSLCEHLAEALGLSSDANERFKLGVDSLRWTSDKHGTDVLILGRKRVVVENNRISMLGILLDGLLPWDHRNNQATLRSRSRLIEAEHTVLYEYDTGRWPCGKSTRDTNNVSQSTERTDLIQSISRDDVLMPHNKPDRITSNKPFTIARWIAYLVRPL